MNSIIPYEIFYKKFSFEPLPTFDLQVWGEHLSDEFLRAVLKDTAFNKQLDDINLSECKQLSKETLGTFCSQMVRVHRLLLSKAPAVDDTTLSALCVSQLLQPTEEPFRVPPRLPLTDLSLEDCVTITDRGLKRFLEVYGAQLEHLNVSGLTRILDSPVAALCLLLKTSHSLRSLKASGTGIGDRIAYALLQQVGIAPLVGRQYNTSGPMAGGLPLQRLTLSSCNKITSEGWTYIMLSMPNLVHLDVSHCVAFDDESLRALWDRPVIYGRAQAKGLPKLKTLIINGCANISDLGMSWYVCGLVGGGSQTRCIAAYTLAL